MREALPADWHLNGMVPQRDVNLLPRVAVPQWLRYNDTLDCVLIETTGDDRLRQRDSGRDSLLFGMATVPAPTVAHYICHCRCSGSLQESSCAIQAS